MHIQLMTAANYMKQKQRQKQMLKILTLYNTKRWTKTRADMEDLNDSINLKLPNLGDTQPRIKESTIFLNIHRKFTKADHYMRGRNSSI